MQMKVLGRQMDEAHEKMQREVIEDAKEAELARREAELHRELTRRRAVARQRENARVNAQLKHQLADRETRLNGGDEMGCTDIMTNHELAINSGAITRVRARCGRRTIAPRAITFAATLHHRPLSSAVARARELFGKICPGQAFLPSADDADGAEADADGGQE